MIYYSRFINIMNAKRLTIGLPISFTFILYS